MTTTAEQMVREARAAIRGLSPAEVEAWIFSEETRLIDVREPEELDEQGLIAGAYHVPRGLLEFWADPASAMHRVELNPDAPTVVYDANGSRSALAAATLAHLGWRDVAHLEGGIAAWKQAGLPVAGLESWHRHDSIPQPPDEGAGR